MKALKQYPTAIIVALSSHMFTEQLIENIFKARIFLFLQQIKCQKWTASNLKTTIEI